jgi:hypothetical protein
VCDGGKGKMRVRGGGVEGIDVYYDVLEADDL